MRCSRILRSILFITVAVFATSARAESGKLNLHVDAGGLFPPYGFQGSVGLDWQFLPGYALDLTAGGAWAGDVDGDGTGFFHSAVGVRFRFLDNREGYLNQKGGDGGGNLYLVPRLGVIVAAPGPAFTFDAQLGYEWSVAKPMQLGVFVKPGVASGPAFHAPAVPYVVVGIGISFEIGRSPPPDSDHDRLSDEREVIRWHSSPYHKDSDADALEDGAEVLDHHTDPTDRDTDHGGSGDGWEVAHHRNPLDPADDDTDEDKVPDERDACPGTPRGTEVDARGCAVLKAKLILEGITFAFNSTAIEAISQPTLERAAQILRDNPKERVEIGGHTDDVGTPAYNAKLSEGRARAVADWLVAQGIPVARLEIRGYGATRPRAPNDGEANRAQNRRIEFRRLGK